MNRRGIALVNLIAIITVTLSFTGFVYLNERLSFSYAKTKNRGETYLCFHRFKETLSKSYINVIETINAVLSSLQTIRMAARYTPYGPIVTAIIRSIQYVLKWIQEGIKAIYLLWISSSKNCDLFQRGHLFYQGVTIYKQRGFLFDRDSLSGGTTIFKTQKHGYFGDLMMKAVNTGFQFLLKKFNIDPKFHIGLDFFSNTKNQKPNEIRPKQESRLNVQDGDGASNDDITIKIHNIRMVDRILNRDADLFTLEGKLEIKGRFAVKGNNEVKETPITANSTIDSVLNKIKNFGIKKWEKFITDTKKVLTKYMDKAKGYFEEFKKWLNK